MSIRKRFLLHADALLSLRTLLPASSRIPRLRRAFEMRVAILAHQKARLGQTLGLALLGYPAGPMGPLPSASCCSSCFFSHFPCVATRHFPVSASCPILPDWEEVVICLNLTYSHSGYILSRCICCCFSQSKKFWQVESWANTLKKKSTNFFSTSS